MDPVDVGWKADEKTRVESSDALVGLVERLHRDSVRAEPMLVEIVRPSGDSLTIGVGRERTVLTFVRGDGDPPYLASVGPEHSDEVVHFFYYGSWSEFPLRNLISWQRAIQAVRHFAQTGGLDENVQWEEA